MIMFNMQCVCFLLPLFFVIQCCNLISFSFHHAFFSPGYWGSLTFMSSFFLFPGLTAFIFQSGVTVELWCLKDVKGPDGPIGFFGMACCRLGLILACWSLWLDWTIIWKLELNSTWNVTELSRASLANYQGQVRQIYSLVSISNFSIEK